MTQRDEATTQLRLTSSSDTDDRRARGSEQAARELRVLLVGFEDQDNLGLRYLMAAARSRGHAVEIVTYTADPSALVGRARAWQPDVIGLSLIFQYMAPEFARVVAALRDGAVVSHITMGGHYASFDYGEVSARMPGLDSVVRFEGEDTVCELLDCLAQGRPWREIDGIACRRDGDVVANRHRAPIEDLDRLPWPDRGTVDYGPSHLPTASILGSRGCPWNCSFCSIRPFYEEQTTQHGGKLRRLRSPADVVAEMRALVEKRSVRVFLFQDDDFLAGGAGRQWAAGIATEITRQGLEGRIAFKISCRSDEVRVDVLAPLTRAGLCHVYMGVESGDPDALTRMNKFLEPETHLAAGAVLRRLGLTFNFGFMLLDPDSTFAEVGNNLRFLERFVGDGWTVATFCRMLPYAGTPLETRLRREGRLLGSPFAPDYRFSDPRLEPFYDWMLQTFRDRNFTDQGLCALLRSLAFEAHLAVSSRGPRFSQSQQSRLHDLIACCNAAAIETLREALRVVEHAPQGAVWADSLELRELTRRELHMERQIRADVLALKREVTRGLRSGPASGFEGSWTLAKTTREARAAQ
jgi:radical SAM superfamily enzyme YgiQ (UPF0313 family)